MKKTHLFSLALITAFLSLWSAPASADVLTGPFLQKDARQNPMGVDWAVLRSEHFNVIFPRALEAEARRVTGILEVVYAPVAEGLQAPPRPIDIILQAHVLNSNGFVTLAPRRSEWYVTPWMGPDVGQTEWLSTLGVHEFRHVVQFEKSRAGFEKFLRVLFGETGTALAIGLSLPPWYLEGDAVGTETALSSGGRGRMPFFARDLRTLLLDGQDYNYEQLFLGSFNNYVPNHYVVGYHMTTYLRRRFGKDVLEKMHRYTMPRSFWPLSFFNSLTKVTGVSFEEAYADCLKELTTLWRAQEALIQLIPAEPLRVDGVRGWTNFSFPSRLPDGSVLALRAGLSHIAQFVRLKKDEAAEVLWTPAPLLQDFPYKVRAGKVAYSEWSLDSRWGAQDFSKVVVKDVTSSETLWRSEESRWLLPVLDHAGARVAVFDWASQQDPTLKVLSLDGKVLHSIPWKRTNAVMGLDWIPGTDKLVVLFRQGTYGVTLSEFGLQGQRRDLAQAVKWNWAYPVATRTHVYFQSAASGIDNIHRVSLKDGLEERVTSERFGAHHPSVTDDELMYAQYTAQGLRPVSMNLSQLKVLPPGPDSFVPYYQPLSEQEGKGDILANVSSSDAKLEEYSAIKNAWNPHSWTLIGNYFGSTITPAIVSTDVLNYFQFVAGLGWNLNERTLQAYTSARWSYLYPILDVNAAFGSRRELDLPVATFGKKEDAWEEGSAEVGMTLPWQSVWRRWVTFASIRPFAGIIHSEGRVLPERGDLGSETISTTGVEARFSMLQRQAPRDLMPPWGVQVLGTYQTGEDISGTDLPQSYQRFTALRPFVPGLLPHHHLFGEVSYEEQEEDGYRFASPILFARGWNYKFMEQRTKTSVNYAFPLWYADWNLSRYFYLKRLSMNLFHDNAWGKRYGTDSRFESNGTELWFDSHFLRNSFMIQWGLRYSNPISKREDDSVELFVNLGVTSF